MTSIPSQDSQLVVILDDDSMVTEALAVGLEREGRTVVTCNDLESAQLIVERLQPSHIVTDVRVSGPFGFEGLELVRFAKQHSAGSRVVLMTGDSPEALPLQSGDLDAAILLRKPFDIAELDAILDLPPRTAPSGLGQLPVIRMPLLDEILTNNALHTFLQPIVELSSRYPVVGHEALTRYRDNSILRNPEMLFQYATRKQRIVDLELACLASSLATGATLPGDRLLFVNIHPHVISHRSALAEVLLREAKHAGINLELVVLEITEQGPLTSGRLLFDNIEELRDTGARFALDDVGVASSHLHLIQRVRPSFLKVSPYVGTAFERDSSRRKVIIDLQSLATDAGCDLIVEGIEDVATARMAETIGVRYGQGFLFGPPSEASDLHEE
jgi:EAL domain-containing protein (putative c-di-GMP-specific phosphodiesterase class I)/ActR/RegA family two-component response regulator